MIFNGEIYNTDELRRNLEARGHRFRTRCDTEVVLAAYVEHQHAAFALFDGISAVAVIDGQRNRVVLARDEFGVKPLFVRSVGGELSFASEPKALRPLGALRDGPDLDQLERFLRYHYVPEPDSPWHNVRRVPRGSYEVYDRDDLSLVGTGRFQQPASDLGDGDWLDRADRAVRLSVTRQLVADRPLGVFLSGGIDSTLVSSYAAELHPGLRAFGIGVAWANDERRWMREATTRLDVDLTETELTEPDFDRLLGSLLDTYDEPFADSSAIPTMLVSEVAAGDLRVVLSGDGGDELFGGYPRYGSAWLAESLGGLPPGLTVARGRCRSAPAATRRASSTAWSTSRGREEAATPGRARSSARRPRPGCWAAPTPPPPPPHRGRPDGPCRGPPATSGPCSTTATSTCRPTCSPRSTAPPCGCRSKPACRCSGHPSPDSPTPCPSASRSGAAWASGR